MSRTKRNNDYDRAGAPTLKDGDPEPLAGMSAGYWRLMLVIGIVAVVVYVIAINL